MQDDLDHILSRRGEPQARPHLAEMIIASASLRPALQRQGFWQGIFVAFDDLFMLPHPAMVLAFVLFIGVTFGLGAGTAAAPAEPVSVQDFAAFMNVADSFDMGEWL